MADVVEIDALTGDVVEREFTPEELAQRVLDAAATEEKLAAVEAALVAKEAARASAMAKLAVLGLEEAEIEALIRPASEVLA